MKRDITGIMMYYYIVCKRKLWYFSNDISMEHTNEDVDIGKTIDSYSYGNEDKHININNIINIDFIREKNVVYEVKKSKKIEEASIFQVKYYLWYLEQFGVEGVTGVIEYPLLRKSKKVILCDEDRVKIEEALLEIKNILCGKMVPELKKKNICGKCAYHDLCFI